MLFRSGDHTGTAGFHNDLSFSLMLLSIQHVVRDACFGQHVADKFGVFDTPPRRKGIGRSMACVCVKIRRVDFYALASNRSPSARIYQGEGGNDGDVR